MKALFTFTIGPVKSFVNNGRKMKDLYSGSAILSALTDHALKEFENGGMKDFDLVFPKRPDPKEEKGQSEDQKITSYPNRLVATVANFSDKKILETAAKKLEVKVRDKFETLCKEILGSNYNDGNGWAMKQINSFLEVYWVFAPFEKAYGKTYGQLFQNLAAIKNLRPFNQTDEPWSRKCGLHLEYNALFYKQEQAYLNVECRYQLPKTPKFKFLLKDKETLSAIAFVKRFYEGSDPHIVSTRDMVFKKRLELDYKGEDGWETWYEKNVVPEDMTHRAGFTTNVIDAVFDRYPKSAASPQVENNEENKEAIEAAKKIISKININKDFPDLKLKSYYAMLKFDGDNMGDVYSELDAKEKHEELSKKLCAFAGKARKIIETAGGICIYAGGEDILATLPLEEIWKKLKELHQAFLDMVKIEGQPEITFSAGIVVAHLMEPLKDVMYRLDESESNAKKYLGDEKFSPKNAFSIKLMKRAGEYRDIRYSFNHQHNYKALNTFMDLIKQLEDEKHSKSFLTNMIKLVEQLPQDHEKCEKWQMIKALIDASISRKSFEKAKSADVIKQVEVLYHASESVRNFTNMLDMIRFLASNAIIHGGDSS